MKQTLIYKKSTKGTYVFGSDKQDAVIPSLYVRKHAFKGEPPKGIEITIKEVEASED